MLQRRRRIAAATLAALVLAGSVVAPLLGVPTATATPTVPAVETLRAPSLEGRPGPASGFALRHDGAELSLIARTGAQSVNLAKAGAAPQASGALGEVEAWPTHHVPLRHVASLALHHQVPAEPPRAIHLEPMLALDLDSDGARDACAVHEALAPLNATSGWARTTLTAAAAFRIAGPDCGSGGATRTLDELLLDAAYANANVTALHVRTRVGTAEAWPAGAAVLVDDLALLARSSTLVRIREASLNLCDGASFADLGVAVACAAEGATLLIGPGTVAGGVVVGKRLTLCGSDLMASECGSTRDDATIRGGGERPLVLDAAGIVLRDLTVENPAYAQTGDVAPALVTVRASDARLEDVRLRQAAAAPGIGEWRHATRAVHAAAGALSLQLVRVNISGMPPSLGLQATCGSGPCRTYGVDASADGTAGLRVVDGRIDLGGAHPSTAIHENEDGLTLVRATILASGKNDDLPASAGIVGDPARTLAGWALREVTVATAANDTARASSGLDARLAAPVIESSTFHLLREGVNLRPGAGAGGARIEGGLFQGNAEGVRNAAPDTRVNGTRFVDNAFALVAAGDGGAAGTSEGLRMTNATIRGPKSLRILAEVAGLHVHARENDWGVYERDQIVARMQVEGSGTTVDDTCYVDRDGVARVCPPVAMFSWSPSSPLWGREVRFLNQSTANGRPITRFEWTFGDGNASTQRDPAHAYATPGARDVTLRVWDENGYTSAVTRTVNVLNRAPVLGSVGDRSVNESQLLLVKLSATDADGDALHYSVTGAPPGAVWNASNRTLMWVPTYAQAGNYTGVRFAVTDGFATAAETITIHVADANAPPTLRVEGTFTGRETEPMTWRVVASDFDGDPLRLSAFVLPQGATFVDHGNGTATFAWTPDYLQSGEYSLVAQATDNKSYARVPVTLVVENLNRAPIWEQKPPQYVYEGQTLAFLVAASDPDGDPIQYAAVNRPAGSTWDAGARSFTWTPALDQEGVHRPRFRAYDGKLETYMEVEIHVLKTNRPPVVLPMPDATTPSNRTLTVTLAAHDEDGDALTFRAIGAPPGVSITGSRLTWRPALDETGTYQFLIEATDVSGGVGNGTLNVTVTPNQPPVILLDLPAHVDVHAFVQLSAARSYDPENAYATLTFEWDMNDADGIGVDRTGSSTGWRFTRPGIHNVTLRVRDPDGMVSTTRFAIDVDDTVHVYVEVEDTYHPTDGKAAAARLTWWNSTGIVGQTLEYVVTYEPVGGVAHELRRGEVTTRGDGWAIFVIPRDALVVNAPGTHRVTVFASVAGSYQGDVEFASGSDTYAQMRS